MKTSPTQESKHLTLGQLGERYAAAYLEQAGYRLVAANFILPVGRNRRDAVIKAELDLIAYDGGTLCFVEVKTRASDWFASPEVNVDRRLANLSGSLCRQRHRVLVGGAFERREQSGSDGHWHLDELAWIDGANYPEHRT